MEKSNLSVATKMLMEHDKIKGSHEVVRRLKQLIELEEVKGFDLVLTSSSEHGTNLNSNYFAHRYGEDIQQELKLAIASIIDANINAHIKWLEDYCAE